MLTIFIAHTLHKYISLRTGVPIFKGFPIHCLTASYKIVFFLNSNANILLIY